MTDSDIIQRARKIISEHLGVEPEKITAEANFIDLGADSLDHIEPVFMFEEEFDIEIMDEQIDGIITFGDAVKFVEKELTTTT